MGIVHVRAVHAELDHAVLLNDLAEDGVVYQLLEDVHHQPA